MTSAILITLAPIACRGSYRNKSLPIPPPAPLCQTESGAIAQNIGAGAGADCHSPCLNAHLPKPRSRLMLAALGHCDLNCSKSLPTPQLSPN
ncbi:MAG: hypothetical protein ACK5CA_12910 [Cyanobacteriota bacterium]|jgi:hypothetical protein